MNMRTIEDLSMFVRAKTTAIKHRQSWILLNHKLGTNELELHGYSVKLTERLGKNDRKALPLITSLTSLTALVLFALKFFKTMGRRWPIKKERASWNVIQWFSAELIEARRILERLRKDLTATEKYFKAGHTLQASDIWKRLTSKLRRSRRTRTRCNIGGGNRARAKK